MVAATALSSCSGAALGGLALRRALRRDRAAPELPLIDGRLDPATAIARYRERTGVEALSVRLYRGASLLYSADLGGYGRATQICVASASKWLVAATLMVQVEKGLLRLADPVGRYVDGLPADYARLRLDQLASFTAGLPSLAHLAEFRQPAGISLAQSARLAAAAGLVSPPGTRFDYGGANLQFIGAAVEAVTVESWHTVFKRDIAGPLGMRSTLWGRMSERPEAARPVSNPLLQAGAWTTADDYCAFLGMLAGDGLAKDRRILGPTALAGLSRIQTLGLRKGFFPPGSLGGTVEYALGHWCERHSGSRCMLESSPGFFGTYPWLDRNGKLFGIIFQSDRFQHISAEVLRLRDELTAFGKR